MRRIFIIVASLAIAGCVDQRASLTDQALEEKQMIREWDRAIGNDRDSGFGP